MASFEQAVETYKKSQGMKQDMIQWWPGFMGDGAGIVNTANNQMCLVRYPFANSPAVPVLDLTGVTRIDGLAVKVGYLPWSPGNLQIISVDDQRLNPSNPADTPVQPGTGTGYVPNSGPHEINHTLFGPDPLFIDMAQVTNLSVQPSSLGGLNVQLFPGTLPQIVGPDTPIAAQTLDLTSSVPVSGARYSLISFNTITGAVVVTDGAINAGGFAALTAADVPDTPAGTWRSAAIALYAGQTAIVRGTTENDFWDLRFPEESPAGTPAGHTIQDEGTPLTTRTNLNFVGAGVTATDDAGNDATVVTIPNVGTVTSIATGTGLTGGPITTTGTISDATTGVAAATYGDASNVPQIAINAQGRITSASNIAISIFTPINVYNETQTADGINATYYLANYAAPGTIRVYIDGIRQPASDDTAPTDIVTFSVVPALNALLMFDYEMDQI